ncbi:GDP-mannose transporter, putative [Ricinus communis]|uniref:GDP-mannose transporter, putative n=1 Tax=Ricinus communis TaxID=3988 RepID=B9SA23_RICCO|nr:GDP-mannose transporter, putative [Ricinus communis]
MEDSSTVSRSGDRLLKLHESNGVVDQISSPLRNEVVNRSSFTMRSHENDEIDLEGGKLEKDRDKTTRSNRALKIQNQALLSGLAYCISSCSMILVNKFVLSSYDFNAGISLMVYQNFISVIIVSVLSFLGIISTEPLTWRLIKVWLPVNVIFVGMLVTSMFSLKYINVAMVTVLKNVTNVITALGEMYLFSKHHDSRVWTALFLMIISAISGGITDLSFHAVGYAWQITNCFLTASYSLTLRRVMDTAKQVTKSGNLNEFSMVLLNNTLSLPLGIILIFVFNEVEYLSKTKSLDSAVIQTPPEITCLLDGNDFQWIFGSGNQLHFYVVSSSNWGYHLQFFVKEKETSQSIKFQLARSVLNPNSSNDPIISSSAASVWPTVDGALGLSEEESIKYARRFYKFGYALLPWLWAVNCFYFWPALRNSRSFPRIRPYVIRSAVGFTAFSILLCSWALTFAIGGERLFGPVWNELVMYNVADRLGLTGWM